MEVHKVNTADLNSVNIQRITDDRLQREYNFNMAQKVLINLRNKGLISEIEFTKITALNIERFSPFLGKIMPEPLDKKAV